jgi:hypothetical protein
MTEIGIIIFMGGDNYAIYLQGSKTFSKGPMPWDYMVVEASLRSYIVHLDQSGLSRPNHKGIRERKWQYSQYNIYNVVNVNKVINDII